MRYKVQLIRGWELLSNPKLWYLFCWLPVAYGVVVAISLLFTDMYILYVPMVVLLCVGAGLFMGFTWAIAITILQESTGKELKTIIRKVVIWTALLYSVIVPIIGFDDPERFDTDTGFTALGMLIIWGIELLAFDMQHCDSVGNHLFFKS